MDYSEIETLIDTSWDGFNVKSKSLKRSFKVLDEKLKFYMNYSIPENYAIDYIKVGGTANFELYNPEFVVDFTQQFPFTSVPSILIGQGNYYYHYYSLYFDLYFSVLKTSFDVEQIHASIEDISVYSLPTYYNEDEDMEGIGDEEE